MNSRRRWLTIAFGLLCLTAARRGRAGDGSVEVEGDGYAGSSTGGWACGPVGRANYGGVAGGARVSERPTETHEGAGWTGHLVVGGEYQSVTIIDKKSQCDEGQRCGPPDKPLVGGKMTVGYRGKYFGLEAGPSVYQGWSSWTSTTPTLGAWPELIASFGPSDGLHGVVALGSPFAYDVQRPGVYGGVGSPLGGGYALEGRLGVYRQGPSVFDEAGPRADLLWKVPLSEVVRLNVGGAVSENRGNVGGDLSLGVGATF